MAQRPKNSPERRYSSERRSGKDRRSLNKPELTRLVDRLEAVKNSFSQKEGTVVETEGREVDQGVSLKFEFDCSEGLARDLIGGIVHLFQGKDGQKRLQDSSEAPHYVNERFRMIEASEESAHEKHAPASPNDKEKDIASIYPKRGRKLSATLLIILLTVATAIGGFEYIAYQKRKTRELAEARQVQENQQLYEQYLASSLDILLTKLDQLTATPKMSQIFPEISSMSETVRFKRGPEAADKARTARGFI